MLRKRPVLTALMAIACLAGAAKDASATVTFSLIWTATTGAGVTGSNVINAYFGDVVTLSIQMTTDQTLAGHFVSLNYDTDLLNELNLFNYPFSNGGKEWAGTSYGTTAMAGTYKPLTECCLGPPFAVESTGSVAGRINTFESGKGTLGAYLPVGTYTIGTARFVANDVYTDGADIFVGLFNPQVGDAVMSNLLVAIPPSGLVFGTASIQSPEPGTASLLGLGLVGLVLVTRRRQASKLN